MVVLFSIKQKTAYEMRISDWSSDVCSSDLTVVQVAEAAGRGGREEFVGILAMILIGPGPLPMRFVAQQQHAPFPAGRHDLVGAELGRASCRDRVCQYV